MSYIGFFLLPLCFSIILGIICVKSLTRDKEDKISDKNVIISYILFTIILFPFFVLVNFIYSSYFSFSFSWMSSIWKFLFN
jgi:cytochrome c biogenesis factor